MLAQTTPLMAGLADAESWWSAALTSPQGVRWAMGFAMSVVAAIWLLALISRGGRGRIRRAEAQPGQPEQKPRRITLRDRLRWLNAEDGTAALETILVLPVLGTIVLVVIQFMLLMVGNLFMHYAAHAATRAAIVQVPLDMTDIGEEEPRWVFPEFGYTKFDAIHTAAAVALVPVAGRDSGLSSDGAAFSDGLADYYFNSGQDAPVWIDNLAGPRLDYALRHTDCYLLYVEGSNPTELIRVEPNDGYEYGPHEPIGVEVVHRLNLSVPYAGLFFADGIHATELGDTPYTEISVSSVMPMQGLPTELPPPPPIPRRLR